MKEFWDKEIINYEECISFLEIKVKICSTIIAAFKKYKVNFDEPHIKQERDYQFIIKNDEHEVISNVKKDIKGYDTVYLENQQEEQEYNDDYYR